MQSFTLLLTLLTAATSLASPVASPIENRASCRRFVGKDPWPTCPDGQRLATRNAHGYICDGKDSITYCSVGQTETTWSLCCTR